MVYAKKRWNIDIKVNCCKELDTTVLNPSNKKNREWLGIIIDT